MLGTDWEENKMERTMSVRIDVEGYEFVKKMAKENKKDLSEAVRNLVDLGRVMYAIEQYKNGKASLGRASELAGQSISEMMRVLSEFGVESNLTRDDYINGFENLKKEW